MNGYKIVSIDLVGYKRIALNGVTSFTAKFTETAQLILGTNGSGKSSLLSELSPLPGKAADFTRDGSKTIRITHRGNNYILTSKFAPSAKHSFVKNGEELNGTSGGTITVQEELVKQEFGYTPQIRDLLTGLEKFTDMSPSRRREWFTILSPIDYDYALEVYNKIKSRSSQTSGALNHAKRRLVTENSKMISQVEEKKLRDEIELIHNELSLLLENRAPVERPSHTYQQEQEQAMDELTRMSNRLLRMRLVAPYGTHPYGVHPRVIERNEWQEPVQHSFNSVEEIEEYINELRHSITAKEALINDKVGEHSKIDETVKILIQTGAEGVNELRAKIVDFEQRKKAVLANRKLKLETEDPINALSSLSFLMEMLTDLFTNLPENADRRFSSAKLTNAKQEILELKDANTIRRSQFNRLQTKKTHLEEHKANGNVACPKCNHVWIIGFSDTEYNRVLKEITEQEAILADEDKKIEAVTNSINEIQAYGDEFRKFTRCVNEWSILSPFWNYLMDDEIVSRSPRKVLTLLSNFSYDLEQDIVAKKYDEEIAGILDLIKSAERVGDANLADSKLRLEECSQIITGLTNDLTFLKKTLMDYSMYRNQLVEAIELGNKISTLSTRVDQITKDMIEMLRRETLNHCIRQLQNSLGIKQEALSTATLQKAIIADLEDQVQKLTVEEEAVKTLLKCLSPTDGLIAEGLMGFIANFVGQMNSLVRKIWAYPLQIHNCGVVGESGAELDYKFPLMVQSKDNVVADVKLGSTGMKEIINLAYAVVSMRYLGLAEAPLILDEFGASFDEAHRGTGMMIIKSLMDAQPFSQLFMVSHYNEFHGSFTNAEVCVMCPSNITVPGEYNKHVSIA